MGYFSNSADVQSYLQSGKSVLVGSNEDYKEIVSAEFFDERINQLEDLRDMLIHSETAFFQKIGINTNDMKDALRQLQEKIDEWNNSGAASMILGDVNKVILEILKLYDGIDLEELVNAYQNELVTSTIIEDQIDEDIEQVVDVDTIFSIMNSDRIKVYTKGHTFQKAKLEKYIVFNKKDNGHYTIDFSGDITPGYKQQFARLFNEIAKEKGLNVHQLEAVDPYSNTEQFKKEILIRIGHYIKAPALDYIAQELNERFTEYAMTHKAGNFAVTKGFLGEVYWNAFFRYLGLPSAPTGTIKDLRGRSIPIDMILEDFGFQIKAYSIKEGQVEFGSNGQTRQVGNFITERAQIPMPVSQALMFLFGSWAYNQPVTDATPEYKELYNNLTATVNATDSVFQYYVDRIIGLDKQFAARANDLLLFQNEQIYYNSFFLINKVPVPGSAIIQAMIDSIRNEETRIKFEGEYSIKSGAKTWPSTPPKDLMTAANQALISYKITVNVEEIIKQVYNYI